VVDRVGLGRVDGITNEEEDEEDRREDESVLDHGLLGSTDEATSTASFGEALAAVGLFHSFVSTQHSSMHRRFLSNRAEQSREDKKK
jgi:hypothetical protein